MNVCQISTDSLHNDQIQRHAIPIICFPISLPHYKMKYQTQFSRQPLTLTVCQHNTHNAFNQTLLSGTIPSLLLSAHYKMKTNTNKLSTFGQQNNNLRFCLPWAYCQPLRVPLRKLTNFNRLF